jgi:hypothetical protein
MAAAVASCGREGILIQDCDVADDVAAMLLLGPSIQQQFWEMRRTEPHDGLEVEVADGGDGGADGFVVVNRGQAPIGRGELLGVSAGTHHVRYAGDPVVTLDAENDFLVAVPRCFYPHEPVDDGTLDARPTQPGHRSWAMSYVATASASLGGAPSNCTFVVVGWPRRGYLPCTLVVATRPIAVGAVLTAAQPDAYVVARLTNAAVDLERRNAELERQLAAALSKIDGQRKTAARLVELLDQAQRRASGYRRAYDQCRRKRRKPASDDEDGDEPPRKRVKVRWCWVGFCFVPPCLVVSRN